MRYVPEIEINKILELREILESIYSSLHFTDNDTKRPLEKPKIELEPMFFPHIVVTESRLVFAITDFLNKIIHSANLIM